jgi:diaminopimelate epimerase
MAFSFTKWQGCGNDFVLVDCFQEKIEDYVSLTKIVCDRHYGIGADGMIFILPSEKADFRMRIFNTDGSEAEMCGNGIRCFARNVYEKGLTDKQEFTVETDAGILKPKLIMENSGNVKQIQVDMGYPVLEAKDIPVNGYGKQRIISKPIEVMGKTYKMTCVSMGNPHCVIFVDDLEKLPIEQLGPLFESHVAFPRKINTEFVEVRDRTHLRMRVWERGAAITLACGTGSCATLVAAVLNDKADKKAEIELDGGKLFVEWAANGKIYMTGPAEQVFSGNFETI